MLRTLPQTENTQFAARLFGIGIFTLLTIASAQLRVEFGGAVPFTMQVLVILLAGLVLGARDGAASQVAYLALIAANLPVDTRMLGLAAFAGPTAGFLVGFPLTAFVAGWLAERGANKLVLRWLAGLVAVATLYLFGASWLLAATGMDVQTAWANAVAPFILLDAIKAVIAAALAEGGRAALVRLTRQ